MGTTSGVSVVDQQCTVSANLSDYKLSLHKRKCVSGKAFEVDLEKKIKENVPYGSWKTPTILYC